MERAIAFLENREGVSAAVEPGVIEHISAACGGDVRKAINAVELLFTAGQRTGNTVSITLSDARSATQRSAMRYDRGGGRPL